MRTTQTFIYRIGRRWHWRVVSAYDDSELARGSDVHVKKCRKQAVAARRQLRNQQAYENHRRH
jgi:hypothetical protein